MGVDYKLFFESNPYELSAYDKAFRIKNSITDLHNWQLGRYFISAIACSFNKDNKYPEKPLFSDMEKETNDDPEANERMGALEMEQWVALLSSQGTLPETQINDIPTKETGT